MVPAIGVYGAAMAIAVAATLAGSLATAHRLKLSLRKSAICLAASGLAAWTGARGWHYLSFWLCGYEVAGGAAHSFAAGGGSLYGGLAAGVAAGGACCRLFHVNALRLADACSVPLALGVAILRVGCWHAGCCFGRPTEVFWAVTPSVGSHAWVFQVANNPLAAVLGPRPVHPTQLYELGAALIAAVLAGAALRSRQTAGVAAFAALVSLTALRWIILPMREYGLDGKFEATTCWVLYPAVVATGVVALRVLRRQRPGYPA